MNESSGISPRDVGEVIENRPCKFVRREMCFTLTRRPASNRSICCVNQCDAESRECSVCQDRRIPPDLSTKVHPLRPHLGRCGRHLLEFWFGTAKPKPAVQGKPQSPPPPTFVPKVVERPRVPVVPWVEPPVLSPSPPVVVKYDEPPATIAPPTVPAAPAPPKRNSGTQRPPKVLRTFEGLVVLRDGQRGDGEEEPVQPVVVPVEPVADLLEERPVDEEVVVGGPAPALVSVPLPVEVMSPEPDQAPVTAGGEPVRELDAEAPRNPAVPVLEPAAVTPCDEKSTPADTREDEAVTESEEALQGGAIPPIEVSGFLLDARFAPLLGETLPNSERLKPEHVRLLGIIGLVQQAVLLDAMDRNSRFKLPDLLFLADEERRRLKDDRAAAQKAIAAIRREAERLEKILVHFGVETLLDSQVLDPAEFRDDAATAVAALLRVRELLGDGT